MNKAYEAGYFTFRPGLVKPACPYADHNDQLKWERGWSDAHAKSLISGYRPSMSVTEVLAKFLAKSKNLIAKSDSVRLIAALSMASGI